jgi:hypothetical protein
MLFRQAPALALLLTPLVIPERVVGQQQPTGPLRHSPRPTVQEITAEDLKTRVYVLADDSMLGRLPGTAGERRATIYLERELRRLGVLTVSEGGGYVQKVPLLTRTVSDSSTMSVDGTALALWTDFVPLPSPDAAGASRQTFDDVPVIYAGPAHDSTRWISGTTAAGKVVVLTHDASRRALPTLRFRRAAAIVLDDLETASPTVLARWRRPRIVLPAAARGFTPGPTVLHVTRATAARLLGSARPDSLMTPGRAGRRVVGVLAFEDASTPGQNVVAVLPGADGRLRGEYVVLMAHLDGLGFNRQPVDTDSLHAFLTERERRAAGASSKSSSATASPAGERAPIHVNMDSLRRLRPARQDSIYNAAMDDASGSAALLEIAEALSGKRGSQPARSLLLVWHTAEEAGTLGSGWYTDHPTVELRAMVAAVNVDGFGRWTSADYQGDRGPRLLVMGARRLSRELGDHVERVNAATRHPLTLDYTFDAPGHPGQGYCASDHRMYVRYGIPSVFLSSPLPADYHQVTDEAQYLDYRGFAYATEFTHDLVVAVANAPHRPTVDGLTPKDPRAACVQ